MFGDEVILQGGQGSSLVNQNNLIMCKVKWCNKEIVDDEGYKTILKFADSMVPLNEIKRECHMKLLKYLEKLFFEQNLK